MDADNVIGASALLRLGIAPLASSWQAPGWALVASTQCAAGPDNLSGNRAAQKLSFKMASSSNTNSAQGSGPNLSQNTVGVEGPSNQHVGAESAQLPGDKQPHQTGHYERSSTDKISQGLDQLGIKLPNDLLNKVLAGPEGKSPMETFLGELHDGHASEADVHGSDDAAWSIAATAGSEDEPPHRH
ncbi:hypothetical protein QQS21_003653 [Conoideocrella luteorostrata]|uniref:Uncharacterized protein n=1 Tax=Conoideocrella luteorostrata TaxID=1105319 RepID=A0AAJ0FVD7_9HYPO|nr:hypothetical protein QQS21_003653 [Conoideocrella luteorostrata]